jgi:phage gpG-like protein
MRILAGLNIDARWETLWRALARIADLSPREVEIVADTARRGIARNFERRTTPGGQPWHPLAKMTQEERKRGIDHRGIPFRVGAKEPILRRTGDLLLSLTDPRHPRNITRSGRWNNETLIILSAEDDPQTPGRIGRLHAGGVTDTGRYVPARPFVGLSDVALEQLDTQVRAVLRQRVERLQ